MHLKKILKFFAVGIISLSLLAFVLSIGVNYFINHQLPKLINEKNDTDYEFEYKSIDFSIFNNTLSLNNVSLSPKDLKSNPKEYHYKAVIETIGISGVDFFKLFSEKKLSAFTIHIDNPDITVYKSAIKIENKDKTKSKLPSEIDIDKITLNQANLKVFNATADTLLNRIYNLNAQIDVLKMGDYIESKELPFTYSDYQFSIDSLFTKINTLQYLRTDAIKIDKSNFDMVNFRLLPINEIHDKKQKSRFDIAVPKINLKGTDWGIENEAFYLNIAQINIDSINFNILNKKQTAIHQQAEIDSIKQNHNLIPFALAIDELNIKKSSFNSLNTFDVQNVNIKIKGISNKVNNQLHIKEFSLNKPRIVQATQNKHKKPKSKNTFKLNDKIIIDQLKIENASYVLKNSVSNKNQITIDQFNLSLHNININESTLKNKIPFTYNNPVLKTGKIHYDTGKYYNLNSSGISISNNNLTVKNLELKPKLSKSAFDASLKYGTDLYTINTGDLLLNNLNWGFDNKNVFYINFDKVILNKVNATIYRNSSIDVKPGLNKLFSQKLRDLNFGLNIKNLELKNTTLVYEEVSKKNHNTGILSFQNLNASINNIYSGYGRKTGPKTTIEVNTNFMNQAKVGVNWSFDIMNKSDNFNIRGTVLNLPAEAMNPFIKPYLYISATGTIAEVDFNFNGNNDVASGTFSMQYDHLKMSIYKDDGEKKRKFLSGLANLVIKKNTHDKLVEHETKPVEREKDKGFFNFFWMNLKQGLKQTLL